MLFPCQQPPAQQMLATFEDSREDIESTTFYESYDSINRITMSAMNHTDSAGSIKVLELEKDEAGAQGMRKLVPVLPEDSVIMEVYAKYLPVVERGVTEDVGLPLIPLINTLVNVIPTEFGILKNTIIPPLVNLPLPNINNDKNKYRPIAALKYRLYDLDSVVVDSGEVAVTRAAADDGKPKRRKKKPTSAKASAGEEETHEYLTLSQGIDDTGFIEVYLENTSEEAVKVYFDDYQITVMSAQEEEEDCSYRYAFNGMEKDDEVYGSEGTSYDFGARMYDPRVGRFFSVDPRWKEFPEFSPFAYALNNPVRFMDKDGFGPGDGVRRLYITEIQIRNSNSGDVKTKYLAKWYYQNVTPEQAQSYKRKSANGWFEVTQNMYEIQQRNPNAFTYSVRGADTPEKPIDISALHREGITPSESKGILEVRASSIAEPQKLYVGYYDEDYNFIDFGVVDLVVSDEEVEYEFEFELPDDVKTMYVLYEGERNIATTDIPDVVRGEATLEIGAHTPAQKGDRAPDNIELFGKEQPVEGVDF